jgi:hypothetical protein
MDSYSQDNKYFKIVSLNKHDPRIQLKKMYEFMRSVFLDFIEISFLGPFVKKEEYFCLMIVQDSKFRTNTIIIAEDRFKSHNYSVQELYNQKEFDLLTREQELEKFVINDSIGYRFYKIKKYGPKNNKDEIKNLTNFRNRLTSVPGNEITGPFVEYWDQRRAPVDVYLILKSLPKNQSIVEQFINIHNDMKFRLLNTDDPLSL